MTLELSDFVKFLDIHHDLLYFAGQKANLLPPDMSKEVFQKKEMQAKFECRQKLYEDDSMIEQYLKGEGSRLRAEEKAIIEGFKNRVSGDFIIFKTLTHYAIFNSMTDNK